MPQLNPTLKRGLIMLVALELIAVSINLFYAPHGVAAGGATGLAIIVQELIGIPLSATTLAVNAVMLALAWWGSGAKFTQGERILYHELKLEVFR